MRYYQSVAHLLSRPFFPVQCGECKTNAVKYFFYPNSTVSQPSLRLPFANIWCLPIKELRDAYGLEAVVVDAGGILVRHDSNHVEDFEMQVVFYWKRELRMRVGILTNSDKEGRVSALQDALNVPVYSAPYNKKKPHPGAYDEVLQGLCIDERVENSIAIGDRKHDIEAANCKGMLTAFVHPFSDNNDPDEITRLRSRELYEMFGKLNIVETPCRLLMK